MTGWLALLAWALGASALHLRGRQRLVLAARAGHEVRGPLCAARLALDGLERSARVEAIDLELRRASLALDDLAGAEHGGRGAERLQTVDVGRLLSDAEQAWRALAVAHGAGAGDRRRARPRGGRPPAPRAGVREPGRQRRRARRRMCARSRVVRRRAASGSRSRTAVPAFLRRSRRSITAARGRRSRRGHGLAIAAAIAERHGGRLTSVPAARGAHLVLDLPEAP